MNAINQTRKFFIYTRKSTDTEDRQVRSIADQLTELRDLAKKEQLEIVDTFVEKQTAKIPGRPIFNDMLARIEKGEASGILAWHPLCQLINLWISLCTFFCTAKKNFFVKDRLSFFLLLLFRSTLTSGRLLWQADV